MQHRIMLRAVAVTAVAALAVLQLPSPASASAPCGIGDRIQINTGAGAEAPSWQWGHKHATGNHYVKQVTAQGILWWADNNGGSDGDTADTFYANVYCDH